MRAGAVLAVVAGLLALPQTAGAHAQLVSTSPERGAQLDASPERVAFRFDEPVEGGFGSVRVFDARGERVDDGDLLRPGGDSDAVGVALRSGLPDGSYTATFRVVSADSHPIAGGFVFSVGEGGAAPSASVAELIDEGDAGPTTDAAFGIVRGLSYLAIALAVGGVLFLVAVWRPGWPAGSEAFDARVRVLAIWTVALGVVTTALGIVLQGANAGGTSFWTALAPGVAGDVLGTRFGTAWGLRLVDWLLLAALVAAPRAWQRWAAPPLLAFLVVSPALSGHAGVTDPAVVLIPADALHVLAMCAWLGGLAALLLAVPAATGRLEPADRTRLLAACLKRFSPVALASVAALIGSGVLQSIVHLESLGDLTGSAFGRAILVKAVLMVALIALGALNLRRNRPDLERLAEEGAPPGGAGRLLRRALRAEVALIVVVLGVTAALTSYPPPAAGAGGPFSAATELGPARLELTVEPASAGTNEIHLYLFDARTGAQYDRPREVTVRLTLPAKDIGPLEPRIDKAGPGHYVARRALVSPPGEWQLVVAARVSDFEEHRARIEVPVE